MTLPPPERTASARATDLASISVDAITSFTAGWSFPPSVVNSFWYSMQTSAVVDGTMVEPPFASAHEKTEKGVLISMGTCALEMFLLVELPIVRAKDVGKAGARARRA